MTEEARNELTGVYCDWLEKWVKRDPCEHGECAGCCLKCNRELVKEASAYLRMNDQ